MGFVLLTRNPKDGKVLAITDDNGDAVAEFDTEEAASDTAADIKVCKAWGYQVVELD